MKNDQNGINDLQLVLKEQYGIEEYYIESITSEELLNNGYIEVPENIVASISSIFQYIPQNVAQFIDAKAANKSFEYAINGSYKVILKPGTKLAESKKTMGAFRGSQLDINTNQLDGQAEFVKNNASLQNSSASRIALNVFNVISFVTGQYFLTQINEKLSSVKKGINHLEQILESDKRSQLKADYQTLEQINKRKEYIKSNDLQLLSTLTELKSIQRNARGNINFYQEQAEIIRNKTNPKDKDKEIEENINNIVTNLIHYRCAVFVYCLAIQLELYLSYDHNVKYVKCVYDDLSEVIKEYKSDHSHYEKVMSTYLYDSIQLNSPGIAQLAADALAITASSIILNKCPFLPDPYSLSHDATRPIDSFFNNRRDKKRNEIVEQLENGLHQSKDLSQIDTSIKGLEQYIEINNGTIELIKIGNKYYSNVTFATEKNDY